MRTMNWKLLAGRKMNERHILGEFLGSGAYGYVYELHDSSQGSDASLAIKLVPATQREDILFQLAREGFYGLVLNHPRVMRLHEFERDTLIDGDQQFAYYYHIMDRAITSLDKVASTLNDETKLEVIGSVIEATHYLHTVANKRHGDIKPKNILLFERIWKLSDFGLIRDTTRGTKKTGQILGSSGWVDPYAVASRSLTTSSDMYACGILIFYLLRNRLPEDADEVSRECKRSPAKEQLLMQLASDLVVERGKRISSGDALVAMRSCGYVPLMEGGTLAITSPKVLRTDSLLKSSSISIYGTSFDEEDIFSAVAPAIHGERVDALSGTIFRSLIEVLPTDLGNQCVAEHQYNHEVGTPRLPSWCGRWCIKGWCEITSEDFGPKTARLTREGQNIVKKRMP